MITLGRRSARLRTVVAVGFLLAVAMLLSVAAPAFAQAAPYPLVPYRGADGSLFCDPAGDISPPESDITCNPNDGTSVYFGTDGVTLTAAFVVAIDPRTTGNQAPLLSNAYSVYLGVNGTSVGSFGVDGKGSNDSDRVFVKCTGNSTLHYDRKVSVALIDGSVQLAPVPNSTFWKLTFTVPLSALAPCGVTSSTPVSLFYATSQAGNLDVVNKDYFSGSTVNFGNSAPIRIEGGLELGKSATAVSGPNPPTVGATTVYDLRVTASNTSVYDLSGVVVTDTLPANVTIQSVSVDAGTTSRSGQTITWSIGAMPTGPVRTMTIRVAVTPTTAQVGTTIPLNPGATGRGTNTGDGSVTNASSPAVSTQTVTGPKLGISKSVSPASVAAGGTVSYTISLANTGTVAASLSQVTDSLPSGFSFIAGSSGGTLGVGAPGVSGDTLTWTGSFSVPAGSTRTVTFQARATTTPGAYDNQASATGPVVGTVSTGPTATVTVTGVADLSLAKSASPSTITAGGTTTYTLVASNAGPSVAGTVTVTDTLPTSMTFLSAGSGCGYDSGSHTVTCTAASVASGSSASFTITVRLAASATGTVANTASVTSPTADPVTGNNTTTLTSAIATSADLRTTKTAPASATSGGDIVYTVAVANAGPSDAAAVRITDVLPTGLTFRSASAGCAYDLGTRTVTCDLGALAATANRSVSITVGSAPGVTGDVTNTARATSTTSDPDPTNDTGSATTTFVPGADLAIVKTGPAQVTAGAGVSWNLSVSNAGPSIATGVSLTDVIPATVALGPLPAGCSYVAATRTLTCDLGSIGPGNSTAVTITGTLDAAASGTLTNTASVTSGATDPSTSNNSSSLTSTIVRRADVSVSLTDAPDPVIAGRDLTYTATVRNLGPSTAVDTSLVLPLPSGVAFSSAPGCTYTTGTRIITCALGTLAPGASVPLTFTVTVASATTGSLSATASVSTTTPDPTSGNDSATATTTVATQADLSVAKTAPATAVAGSTITYAVAVQNLGPSDAGSVTVADVLPLGVTFQSASAGCSYTTLSRTVTCSLGTIPAGSTSTATITVVVGVTTSGDVINTASATTTTPDPVGANDSSSATTTVGADADLVATIVDLADPVAAGTPVTYRMTVRNAGPSTAMSATALVDLPDGTTPTVFPASCLPVLGTNDLRCGLGTLAPGASTTFDVTALTSPALTGVMTAQVTASSSTADSVPGNNTDVTTTALQVINDVVVQLTDSPDPVAAGTDLRYAISISNGGPSSARDLAIRLPLPAGTTFVSGSAGCTQSGGVVTCDVGTVSPSSTVSLDVIVRVASTLAPGTLLDATASAVSRIDGSPYADSQPADNQDSTTTTVTRSADLAISMGAAPDPVVAGRDLTYTISVANLGPSTATDVVVSDPLPTGLTWVSGSGCTFNASTRTVSCSVASLAPGGSFTASFVVTVASATTGSVTNSATVSAATVDPVASNDTATATTNVTARADLSVGIVDTPDPVVAGEPLRYLVTVTNLGPSDARDGRVRLPMPTDVTFVSAPAGCTYDVPTRTVTCVLGTIVAGGSTSVEIRGTTATTASGTISAQATASTTTPDPVSGNDTATATTTVGAAADLRVTLSGAPSSPIAGGTLTYTLGADNFGPSTARGVRVSVVLPAAVTFVSAPVGCTHAPATRTVTCDLGDLTSGGSGSASIVVTVAGAAPATLVANASVTSGTPDPVSGNNTTTSTLTVQRRADLSVSVATSPDPVVAGTDLTATWTVRNAGPSDATSVVATQILPAGLTFVSSPTCTYDAGTRTVTCTATTLTAGATASFTVVTRVAPSAIGSVTTTVDVTSATTDPDTSNNQASRATAVTRVADLAVAIGGAPDPVTPGGSLTLTATVTNTGPSASGAATVRIPLPAGTTFVSAPAACTYDVGTRTVTCPVAALAFGGASSVSITVAVAPNTVGDITATASVTSADDPDPTDDQASTTIATAPSADLLATISASPEPATAGGTVTLRLGATNTGPSAATAVTVSTVLPVSVSFVSAAPGCSFDSTTRRLACTLGPIAAGASASLDATIRLGAAMTGSVTWTATVGSSTPDPDSANDSASTTTTIITRANAAISLTDSPDPVDAGRFLDVVATITTAGPSLARDVTATITLASGTSFVSGDGRCALATDGRSLTCRLGDLAPGTTATLPLRLIVDAAVAGGTTLTTAGTVTMATTDTTPADDSGSTTTTVAIADDLAVSIDATPEPVVAGTRLTSLVTVSNVGPSDSPSASVMLPLPVGVTFVSAPGCTYDSGARTVTCALGSITAGSSADVTVTVLVAPGTTGTLTMVASASGFADPVPANDSASDAVEVTTSADLATTISLNPDPVTAGRDLTATVTVRSSGPSDASNVVVTVPIPSGATPASLPAGCTANATTVTCIIGSLPAGGTVSLPIVFTTPATGTGSVTVSAATSSSTPDPNSANDRATATAAYAQVADLSVRLTADPDPVVAGNALTYAIAVTNNGPSTATGVTVTLPLPAGVTYASADPRCDHDTATNTVTCTIASLPVGGTATLSPAVVVQVDATRSGTTISATATVRSTASTDPVTGNDRSTASTTVTGQADLSLAITATPDPVVAGRTLTVTPRVTNSGPSEARGVVVVVPLPTGSVFVSAPTGCTYDAGSRTVTCTVGTVGPGASVDLAIVTTVAPSQTGSLSLSASATSPTPDPDSDDRSATTTVTVTAVADLEVTLTDAPDPVTAGGLLTYSIAVRNVGPSDAVGVRVSVPLPAGTTLVSAPAGCTVGGGNVVCDLATVPSGTTSTLTLTVRVSASQTGPLSTTATVTSTTTDPVAGNNTSTATTAVGSQADLSVQISAGPEPVVAGQTLDYTLTATNTGPSTSRDVTVSHVLPAGVDFVAATPGCTYDLASRTVTCRVATLAPGAGSAVTFGVTTRVRSDQTGTLTSTATITSATTADPSLADNSATVRSSVVTRADLLVTISDSPDPVVAGRDLTYTVTVTNRGPSDAVSVVVSDPLPAGLAFVSAPDCVWDAPSRTVACSLPGLASGASRTFTIVTRVAPSQTTTISNSVTVTSATVDPDHTNDQATATTSVDGSANLAVAVAISPTPIVAGETFTTTISVTNAGPSTARGIVVSEPLPAGATFVSADPRCSYDATTRRVTCDVGLLAPGSTVSVEVVARLATTATGTLTAAASVSSTTPDPDPTDNRDSTSVAVSERADLAISVVDTPDPVVAGTDLSYRVSVRNGGPSAARDTSVRFALPAGTTFDATASDPRCLESAGTVTCTLGTVAAGATETFDVVLGVDAGATPGSVLIADVRVSTAATDPSPGDNVARVATTVAVDGDLRIAITDAPDPVTAGRAATYTVVVTAGGPSDASGVTVTMPVPAGTTFDGSASDPRCTEVGTDIVCTIGAMVQSTQTSLTVVLVTDPALTGSIVVAGTVASTSADSAPANNRVTETTTVVSSADLRVTVSDTTAAAGTQATTTIRVTNDGPSNATGVTVRIPLPTGASFAGVDASTTAGVTCALDGATTTVVCNVGGVARGATATIGLLLDLAPTASGSLRVPATVASGTADPVATNDRAEGTITVGSTADISVSVSLDPATVAAGERTRGTVTVTNVGPSDATGVEVVITIPADVTLATVPAGCTYDSGSRLLTCQLGSLPTSSAGSVVVSLDVVSNASGSFVLEGVVTTSSADPDPSNNRDSATATVTASADVSVAVSASPSPAIAGAPVSVTVTAGNNGPSPAEAVEVTLEIPSGATIRTLPANCRVVGTTIRCDLGTVAAGSSAAVLIRFDVLPSTTSSLRLDATVGAVTADPDRANNTASRSVPVVRSANVGTTITASPSPATAGRTVTATVTAVNNGSSDASGVTLTVDIPAGLTVVGALPTGCALDGTGRVVTCSVATLPAQSARTFNFDLAVAPSVASPFTLRSTVTSTTSDPDPSDDRDEVTVRVQGSADLRIGIDLTPDPVVSGTELRGTVTVTNAGPSDAQGTVVTVPLPAELSLVSTSPGCTFDAVARVISCAIGAIAANGSATILIVTTVAPSATGTVTVSATASATTPDPVPTNGTASDTVLVRPSADLSLVVTDTPDPVAAGARLTTTFTVRNSGPSDAAGVEVTVPVPSGLAFVSGTGCSASGGVVTCTVGALASGTTASTAIVWQVAADATGTIRVTGTAGSRTADPDTGNDTATSVTTVGRAADLSVTVTATPDPVAAGTDLVATFAVTNSGPSDTAPVTLTIPVPAGLSPVAPPAGCTYDAVRRILTCTIASLASGTTTSIAVTFAVDPGATGQITISGTATSPAIDPDRSDDTGSTVVAVVVDNDLRLSLTATPSPVTAGTQLTYTVKVTNTGPSVATQVVVTDPLPSSVTFVSAPSDCVFEPSTRVLTCRLGDLAPGTTVTRDVIVTVASQVTGNITNSATVRASVADANPADDQATVTTPVNPRADLGLTLTATPDPVTAGSNLTLTARVTNAGPSDATSVTVTVPLPPGLSVVSLPTGCSVDATRTVTCTLARVASGATVDLAMVLAVAPSASDSLQVTGIVGSVVPDPNGTNDQASRTIAVRRTADLAVALAAAPAPATAGAPLTYTVTVTNQGPSDAPASVVRLTLPAGVGVGALPAGCAFDATSRQVTCDLGTIASGASLTRVIATTVGPGTTGVIRATADVSSAAVDPVATNDRRSVDTTVVASADLTLSVVDSPDPVVAGQTITYAVRVTNSGPSDATDVVVRIPLPAGTSAGTLPAGCVLDPSTATVVCTIPTLAAGAGTTLSVPVVVSPSRTAPVATTVSVTSSSADPDTSGNAVPVTTAVLTRADVALAIAVSPDPLTAGGPAQVTVTASNLGPSTAADVVVSIPLPSGFALGATPPGCTYQPSTRTLTCQLGALTPGSASSVLLRGTVASSATGNVTFTSTVATSTFDPVATNDTASRRVAVVTTADLAISLSDAPDPVAAGATTTITARVTNVGPSDVASATVTFTVPSGTTVVSAAAGCTQAGMEVTCPVGPIPSGGSASISLTLRVDAAVAGGTVLTTTARVASATDANAANDTASEPTTVTVNNAIVLTLRDTPDPVVAGERITYTLSVRNTGPSDAPGEVITIRLPSGLTDVILPSGCNRSGTTITCTRDLAAGATIDLVVSGRVPADRVASLTADATARSATVTATTTVTRVADLSTTVTSTPSPVTAGTTLTSRVTVTNAGPSATPGATVTIPVPAGTTVGSLPSGCTPSGAVIECTVGPIDSGGSVSLDVAFVVAPSRTAPVTVVATVSSQVSDPVSTNDTGSATTAVSTSADLTTTLSATPSPVAAGRVLTVTTTVTNAGPSDATDVTVTIPIPAGTTLTTTPTGCVLAGSTVTCTLGTVAKGAAVSVVLDLRVAASATGSVTTTATASSTTPDPDVRGNSATLTTPISAVADLAITLTDTPDPVIAGGTVTITATVRNVGPSSASGVVVTVVVPADVTVVAPAGCTLGTDGRTLTCLVGAMAVDAVETRSIQLTLAPSVSGVITTTAAVGSTTTDPSADNDRASTSTTVSARSDLAVTTSASPVPAIPGAPVTWTTTVANAGPSTATAVVLTLPLPTGATLAGVLDPRCSLTAGLITCRLGDVPSGSTVSVPVTYRTDPASTGSLAQPVAVSSTTPDPSSADNTMTGSVALVPTADLIVTVDDGVDTIVAGQPLTWTVTVRNGGPSTATSVRIVDTLPDGVTFVDASAGCVWDRTARTVTCDIGTLDPEGLASVTIAVTVDRATTGTLTNTASATSAAVDPTPGDATASDTTTVTAPASPPPPAPGPAPAPAPATLRIGITATPNPVMAGSDLTYEVTVRNPSDQVAEAVAVRVALPPGITIREVPTGCTVTGVEVRCTIGDLLPGQVAVLPILVVVDPMVTGDLTATAEAMMAGDAATSVVAAVSTAVATSADLRVTITGQLIDGRITWTATVRNGGPNVARNVELVVALPAGVGFDAIAGDPLAGQRLAAAIQSLTGVQCAYDPGAHLVRCVVGTLAPGDEATVVVLTTVEPGVVGELEAVASATSSTADPTEADNRAVATVRIAAVEPPVDEPPVQEPPSAPEPPVLPRTGADPVPAAATGLAMLLLGLVLLRRGRAEAPVT